MEDEVRQADALERGLRAEGMAVDVARTGTDGLWMATETNYDAIILDLLMPGRSGLELLEDWRRRGDTTPILVLTALHAVEDRVRGLALGADDYLVKPFAIEELLARLEAIVRRNRGQSDSRIRLGDLEIDLAARSVRSAGKEILLTALEFALLECLARRPGQILTREQIESHLYGADSSPLSNAVDAAVYSLRRKLSPGNEPPLLHTRRGQGYVMQENP